MSNLRNYEMAKGREAQYVCSVYGHWRYVYLWCSHVCSERISLRIEKEKSKIKFTTNYRSLNIWYISGSLWKLSYLSEYNSKLPFGLYTVRCVRLLEC